MSDWSAVPYAVRQRIKSALIARDGLACCRCGKSITIAEATIEHLVERSAGGGNELANLALACGPCNYGRRGSRRRSAPCRDIDNTQWLRFF